MSSSISGQKLLKPGSKGEDVHRRKLYSVYQARTLTHEKKDYETGHSFSVCLYMLDNGQRWGLGVGECYHNSHPPLFHTLTPPSPAAVPRPPYFGSFPASCHFRMALPFWTPAKTYFWRWSARSSTPGPVTVRLHTHPSTHTHTHPHTYIHTHPHTQTHQVGKCYNESLVVVFIFGHFSSIFSEEP